MRLWSGSGRVSRKLDPSCRAHSGLIAGWLAVAVAVIVLGPVSAKAAVRASIVVDAQTGAVLEAHNPDRLTYPASLAKLMTLYITFQQLNSGKLTLHQQLQVSPHAAAQSPTKLYLHPGSEISVESAILGIATRSANDAAVVLAEAVGGTEWKFAVLMNRKARLLGLDHTTFCNASGLPNPRQKTTARDMATLALAILHNDPQYYHFFKAKSFVFRGNRIDGHDHLLGRYPGVDGMKTGYTRASGYNLVTSSVRDGRRLVGVVMGGSTVRSRDHLMMALLNRSFSRERTKTLTASAEVEARPARKESEYVKVADDDIERAPIARPSGEWIVQIGGNFRNRYAVRRALESALHTAPRPLEGARPLAIKLEGRRYSARFSNMSERMAWQTCRLLRRKKFACKVIRLRPSGIALASAGR